MENKVFFIPELVINSINFILKINNLKLTSVIMLATFFILIILPINAQTTPNSLSSNFGLKEDDWIKYKITTLTVQSNIDQTTVEQNIRSSTFNMISQNSTNYHALTSSEYIKKRVIRVSDSVLSFENMLGLDNGDEKKIGFSTFDVKNYKGYFPLVISTDLQIGDTIPTGIEPKPIDTNTGEGLMQDNLKVKGIDKIVIAGKNIQAFRLSSTSSNFDYSGNKLQTDTTNYYDTNTGILLLSNIKMNGDIGSEWMNTNEIITAIDASNDVLEQKDPNKGKFCILWWCW